MDVTARLGLDASRLALPQMGLRRRQLRENEVVFMRRFVRGRLSGEREVGQQKEQREKGEDHQYCVFIDTPGDDAQAMR